MLSASQIETYLDCPYKWFSLRRLRLGTVDAGHTGMEMGTFAHRVLEVTHRELLARALEAQSPGVPRDELLAQIEADPARARARLARGRGEPRGGARGARARVRPAPAAHVHGQAPARNLQLLVAHDSSERAQEDQLREDLRSSLAYQTRILQGFEPRLFEWGFGRRGDLVEYAGAYFTGTVDRIDVSPHGTAVIIDYKHKSPNGFAAEYDALQDGVLEGEKLPNRVQSLIYAQVVRRAFEGRLRLVGSVYLSTKSPHALAGVADENVVDLVFGRVSSQRVAACACRATWRAERHGRPARPHRGAGGRAGAADACGQRGGAPARRALLRLLPGHAVREKGGPIMAGIDLSRLNAGQRSVVQRLDEPLFVAAGAGSGKTFTLTARLVHALSEGSAADGGRYLDSIDQALVITFTDAAALEIKERVRQALRAAGEDDPFLREESLKVDAAWISTIHGMCSRILHRHAIELGIDPSSRWCEGSVAEALMARALDEVMARCSATTPMRTCARSTRCGLRAQARWSA